MKKKLQPLGMQPTIHAGVMLVAVFDSWTRLVNCNSYFLLK